MQRLWKTVFAGTLAVATVGGATTDADPSRGHDSPPANAADNAASGPDTTVTLVTGDTVVLPDGDRDDAYVEPADGRSEVSFDISSPGDGLEVLPADAVPYIADGTLDDRLFDLGTLIDAGYDDESTDILPLMVSNADTAVADAALAEAGATVTAELRALDGAAVEVDKKQAAAFWSALTSDSVPLADADRVWLDATGDASLDESTDQIGAPAAWDAGLTGEGVTIAVLDSGIDDSHPDLAGRVAAAKDFTGAGSEDRLGHGTHVASIAAGTGAASDGTYQGVAPEATLLDGKVLDGEGSFRTSDVIQAMQWAVDQGAQVVNTSLGRRPRPGDTFPHPTEEAANTLTEESGTLFVAAAGNTGPEARSVDVPASAESVLAVGATDATGAVWEQSSRGPRHAASAVKPDVMAPGAEVTGARSDAHVADPNGGDYVTDSGTSLSSPMVAGAAALLLEKDPELDAQDLTARLTGSADPRAGLPAYTQGAGQLDVAAALDQTVTAEPASVDFGVREWPHADAAPVDRTVTYTNSGDQDVDLELSVSTSGPGDTVPPEGMVTLADTALTVPAGGTAETTLTTDPSVDVPTGAYSGHLTATSGERRTTTPFGMVREPELYDVTFTVTDRDGAPADDFTLQLRHHDDDNADQWFPGTRHGSEFTVRTRPGRYYLTAHFGDGRTTMLVRPLLEVAEDTTVEVDARVAEPVSVTVPDKSATPERASVGFELQLDDDSRQFSRSLPGLADRRIGHIGPELDEDQFEARVVGFWSTDTDDRYAAAWYEGGRMFDGLQRELRPKDLATVRLDVHSEGPDRTGSGEIVTTGPFRGVETSGDLPEVDLPTTLDLHVTGEVHWQVAFGQDQNPHTLQTVPTRYEPGRTHREAWNAAVIGPGLVTPDGSAAVTTRNGGVDVDVPLLADRSGHPGTTTFHDLDGTHTALYADGALVDENDRPGRGQFEVPTNASELRLETSLTRVPAVAHLSTRVDVSWTFDAGQVTDTGIDAGALPLSVARFWPLVDRRNQAPDFPAALVPVAIETSPDTPPGQLARLEVEASYDDGEDWTDAPVLRFGPVRLALLRHESDAEFVSLRATATDENGTMVEQTIRRAYELGAE